MSPSNLRKPAKTRSGVTVVLATSLAVITIDGLDLIMYGAVLPTLIETKQWGITAPTAGIVGSAALVGMLLGAMFAGYIADIVGRRPVILACVGSFSVFTTLCAIAPTLESFGLLRLLAGLGFGGSLPTVIALTMEYVRYDRRQFYNGVIQTGFTWGGCLAAVSAIFVIPAWGWQHMFTIGGVVGSVVFVVAYRTLPESIAFLARKGRDDEVREIIARYRLDAHAESAAALDVAAPKARANGLSFLTARGFRIASFVFPLICFCGLLAAYGMGTWMPQLLRASGYDLGSALVFLLAFNLGSATGMVVLAGLADRFGSRRVIASGFLCGATAIAALTLQPTQAVVFTLVLVVGFCLSSQITVAGFVGVYYPPQARGTALGLALGLGRIGGVCGPIIGGVIVGSTLGSQWAFYTFAAACVAAALLVVLVPRSSAGPIDSVRVRAQLDAQSP